MRGDRRLPLRAAPRVVASILLTLSAAAAACGPDLTTPPTVQPFVPTATYPAVPTFPVPAELLATPVASMPAGFGPATWALDPAFPVPDANTSELHLLVWESACSGGAPATGRISPPVVVVGPANVTITLGVRGLEVPPGYAVTCPGPPGTPAILRVPEPLGSRELQHGDGCSPQLVRASPAVFDLGCEQ